MSKQSREVAHFIRGFRPSHAQCTEWSEFFFLDDGAKNRYISFLSPLLAKPLLRRANPIVKKGHVTRRRRTDSSWSADKARVRGPDAGTQLP
jgi:hypothetical protein